MRVGSSEKEIGGGVSNRKNNERWGNIENREISGKNTRGEKEAVEKVKNPS